MKRLFKSKAGILALGLFAVIMALMLHRVSSRSKMRQTEAARYGMGGNTDKQRKEQPDDETKAGEALLENSQQQTSSKPDAAADIRRTKPEAEKETQESSRKSEQRPESKSILDGAQEELNFLDRSLSLGNQSKTDRDRQGRPVTRRKTSKTTGAGTNAEEASAKTKGGSKLQLRLGGTESTTSSRRKSSKASAAETPGDEATAGTEITKTSGLALQGKETEAGDLGFCPYGRPIKCELVFTLDSTMEQTPIIALVMEPVYNNGQLVIPAGAELHGMARPDRLRDRIFSSSDWVLLLPRQGSLPNGRELSVRGLALDRAEPASNGMTWGITDGSNGLQGSVVRTLEAEEVKRFAASFISAAALGLQERENNSRNGTRFTNSPANAALQGLSANLEDLAKKISEEVSKHGVFLRVPGGKQFYFYPQQAIHPSQARIPPPSRRLMAKPKEEDTNDSAKTTL